MLEKVAYIKGLLQGMKLKDEDPYKELFVNIVDVLEDMAGAIADAEDNIIGWTIDGTEFVDGDRATFIKIAVRALGAFVPTLTKLLTGDNKAVIIPNGSAANATIINYTQEDYRRLDLHFSIDYNSDVISRSFRIVLESDGDSYSI